MHGNRYGFLFVLVLEALIFCFGSSPTEGSNSCSVVRQYHEELLNFIRGFREKELNGQHNVAIAFVRVVVVSQEKIINVSDFFPVFPEKAIQRIPDNGDRRYTHVFTSLGYNQKQTDLCTYRDKEGGRSYKEFFKGSHALSPNQLLNIKEMYACTEPQMLFSIIHNWEEWVNIFCQLFQKTIAKKIKRPEGSYSLFIEVHISSYWSPCRNCSHLISNFIHAVTTNQLCQGASAHRKIKPSNVNWAIYYSYNKEYGQQLDRVCVEGERLLNPTMVWKEGDCACVKYERAIAKP